MDDVDPLTVENAPRLRRADEVLQLPPLEHQPGSIGYIEKLFLAELMLMVQPRLVVETGTFLGHTTRFLAEVARRNALEGCRVVSFDLPAVVERLRAADPSLDASKDVQLVGGELPRSLERFLAALPASEQVGLAVVDAQHTYRAVRSELELLHPRLAPGAYVFCHDYREKDPMQEGVVYAVDRFALERGYGKLPLASASGRGDEVVWGAAILRKPAATRSPFRHAAHRAKARLSPLARGVRRVLHRG